MLVTSVVVFTYYTIWTLFTVSGKLSPKGAEAQAHVLAQLSAAFPPTRLALARLVSRSRVGSADTGIGTAGRLDDDWLIRRTGPGEERQEEASAGENGIVERTQCCKMR